MSKAARGTLGVDIGDHVRAQVALDEAPREVEVPEDLASALVADPGVAQALTALAYTHRKECAVWVTGAKRTETRQRRVPQAIEMIREGRTRS